MAELKTQKNESSVLEFLDGIADQKKRENSFIILEIMKDITKDEPKMWGNSIIGFGDFHYKYDSGREADWFIIGFSPRKQSLTLYLHYGFEKQQDLMEKLGKYKTGKACLYINKLDDVNIEVLKELIKRSVTVIKKSIA